jgi:glyoxylase I family protein
MVLRVLVRRVLSAVKLHLGSLTDRARGGPPGTSLATDGVLAKGGKESQMTTATETARNAREKGSGEHRFIQGVHGVRYQVKDVARSVAFYTTHLGFSLEHQQPPAFASISLGDVQILLSGPGASGSRPMPGGQPQEPGGWNRVVLRVKDLPGFIDELKKADLHFRNEMETGPGGKQIQIEDPDGNPIELFEPAR